MDSDLKISTDPELNMSDELSTLTESESNISIKTESNESAEAESNGSAESELKSFEDQELNDSKNHESKDCKDHESKDSEDQELKDSEGHESKTNHEAKNFEDNESKESSEVKLSTESDIKMSIESEPMSLKSESKVSIDSSTSDLSSDWDIIASFTSNMDDKENPDSLENETIEQQEVTMEEKLDEVTLLGSRCIDLEPSCSCESSSSCSDIEVIDEHIEQISNTPVFTMPVPQTIISSQEIQREEQQELNTNLDVIPSESSRAVNNLLQPANIQYLPAIAENNPLPSMRNILKILIGLLLCISSWNYIHYSTAYKEDLKEMLQHMKHLTETFRLENAELRDQLLSEVHNKKLYSSLETQIGELKNENLKLNQMLQDMISDLQKPSHFIQSEFLSNEINKLKDQINVLKFENEELQSQVAKSRYSGHSQKLPESHKKDKIDAKIAMKSEVNAPKTELKEENGGKQNETDENGTQSKNVNELHEELVLEIAKIKQWNEIVEAITKELHKSVKAEKEKKWNFHDVKQSLNGIIQEAQKNIADTVGNLKKLNVTEMFSKYINYNYDDQKTKDFLDYIKQHIKATKERTMDILKSSPDRDTVMNSAWNTVKKLSKKWNRLTEMFGMREYNHADEDKNEAKYAKYDKAKHEGNKHGTSEGKVFQEDTENVHDPEGNWYFKKNQGDSSKEQEPSSWMFNRAAYRENIRNHDDSVNWYLKRKKYQHRNTFVDDSDEDHYPHY